MTRTPRVYAPYGLCLACACLLPGGCRDEPDPPKARVLDGVIERIDLPGRQVTVRFYAEKQRAELKQTVRVNDATEVMINGALARVEDIQEGERARGEVLIERPNDDVVYTAKRIVILRAEPLKPRPAEPRNEGVGS